MTVAMNLSRRKFTQLLGASVATAAAHPAAAFAKLAAAASPSSASRSGIVRLSANENPYGPSPKAVQAMRDAFDLVCRYPDEHADALVAALAKLNGVASEQILLGDGSSEILKLAAEAFTGPRGTLVTADPTFEAILQYAASGGAKVEKIPLTSKFGHDLPRMKDSVESGLVYLCNPNNPTASITPKDDVRSFITHASPQTTILVDEAYFHYADSPDYESVIPLIKDHPNLIVARTFSKIYGMAGLRCGYAVAQKETIDRLRSHQPWDSVNIMALVAATANLDDPDQVANGRRLNSEARKFTLEVLDKLGYQTIPSQANFIMVDVKRPVVPLIQAMKQRKVQVGRLFPAMPDYMRVTIGKKAEMETFLAAFRDSIA